MERIRDSDGAKDNRFREGDPRNGNFPTRVRAYWLNGVQEEIATAITKSGLSLDGDKTDQLYHSIKRASPYDVIVESPEDLEEAITNAKDHTSIFVRAFDWNITTSPLRLTANFVLIQLSPATRLIGRPRSQDEGGLSEGEGILEISGDNCTVLGGTWDFSEDPENKYHAVKFLKTETAIKPFFGLSRIKSKLLNSSTIPPNTILSF